MLTYWVPAAVTTQIFQNLGPDAGAKLDMAAFAELRYVVYPDHSLWRPPSSHNKYRPVLTLGKSDNPMSAKTIADVIIYLASDNSAGMNGSLVPVDDGWCCI